MTPVCRPPFRCRWYSPGKHFGSARLATGTVVAKAGMNDCGTSTHQCSGNAAKDGMADEWLYVP